MFETNVNLRKQYLEFLFIIYQISIIYILYNLYILYFTGRSLTRVGPFTCRPPGAAVESIEPDQIRPVM